MDSKLNEQEATSLKGHGRKRILHVIPTLDRGGAEKQLALLAAGLPRDEFEVQVCALTRGGPLEANLRTADVPLTVIGKRAKIDPVAWWRLRQFIRREQPDLVQTWLFAANSYGRTAAWSAGAKRVIASERCVDAWKKPHHLWIDRKLARRTDRVVVNSPAIRDFYTAAGLPDEKFEVIPNGVSALPASTRSRGDLLAEIDAPTDALLVGCMARLWPQKGIKTLMLAVEVLRSINYPVHLVVLGDGPLKEPLLRFRRQIEMDDRIHFLGQRDDVSDWLPHFMCVALSSHYEGQPNVLLEAHMSSVPVVASDVPGVRDLVTHDVTGLLAPPGDHIAFCRRIKQLVDDPALRTRLSSAGRSFAAREHSIPAMLDRYIALYRRLL